LHSLISLQVEILYAYYGVESIGQALFLFEHISF